MPIITPNLWFDTWATEAAELYVSVFPRSAGTAITHYGEAGPGVPGSVLTDGGEESRCGWLEDRYGLSWQVCPAGMNELLNDPDRARAERAMTAVLSMGRIDVAAIHAAADGRQGD